MTDTRFLLLGEVRSAEAALLGMLDAGRAPVAIITTDIAAVRASSGMGEAYYADLVDMGRRLEIPVHVVTGLTPLASLIARYEVTYTFAIGWPYLIPRADLDAGVFVGMHPTRLPDRRGGAPLNWLILDLEPSAAVTLFRLRPGIDDGEILHQGDYPISRQDYVNDVLERVCLALRTAVAAVVPDLIAGRADWRTQDDGAATYTRRRTPADGRIDWRETSRRIHALVRAVSDPFPGAWTTLGSAAVTVWKAEVPHGYRAPRGSGPGRVLATSDRGTLVATADNALLLTELALEGEILGRRERRAWAEEHLGAVLGEIW